MFFAKEIEKINSHGWDFCRIGIYQEDELIGDYIRYYPTLYKTFLPFAKNDNWYALYSKRHTTTRIMELPSCKDIGGEKYSAKGFCPMEYFVFESRTKGLVIGCYASKPWEIKLIDLSKVEKGIIKRQP